MSLQPELQTKVKIKRSRDYKREDNLLRRNTRMFVQTYISFKFKWSTVQENPKKKSRKRIKTVEMKCIIPNLSVITRTVMVKLFLKILTLHRHIQKFLLLLISNTLSHSSFYQASNLNIIRVPGHCCYFKNIQKVHRY